MKTKKLLMFITALAVLPFPSSKGCIHANFPCIKTASSNGCRLFLFALYHLYKFNRCFLTSLFSGGTCLEPSILTSKNLILPE